MFDFPANPPLGLYIHVPWCVRKCPYCDFNSHRAPERIPEQAYVDALIRDLEQELPRVWGRVVDSIFIGGGTPSLLGGAAVARLLGAVRSLVPCRPGLEVTLEANPGTAEQARFRAYREAGINRLSIGIQSLDDGCLQRLGRIHDRTQALRAVEASREAGFSNLNLDIMYGLPEQDVEGALQDLRQVIALAPTHLSWYQLTLEPNTLFHHCPPRLPDDDALWTIQESGQSFLASHGYTQYEVSAYAPCGRECRHNLNYWRFGDYLGIGAGAHGKITRGGAGRVERTWKVKHPGDYLERAGTGAATAGETGLRVRDVILEFMMNGLRLTSGFSREHFVRAAGLPFGLIEPLVLQAQADGLLEADATLIRPTALGRRFLNDLVARFEIEDGVDD